MGIHTIVSKTNAVLYEGDYHDFAACLEDAVASSADLAHADLRHKNLANACLDDGQFAGADFSGANLAGTNLSETCLEGASLRGADLYNTCFACSRLKGCDFSGASFGATDIAGADISAAKFSTLSCFSLDFLGAERMDNCRFTNTDGHSATFSRPPVVVRGIGAKLVVFTERCWLNGDAILPYPQQFLPLPFWVKNAQPLRKA